MIPDLTFVEEAFSRFNAEIFGGSLPAPRLVLTRARTFRGKLVYSWQRTLLGKRRCSDFEIRISVYFDLDREVWEDVVIHEMIHYHIAYNGLRDTSPHGILFRTMMRDINARFGRHIAVSARSLPEERADTQARAHYVCIARFSDGRLGVAPVAKTRIFELRDAFAAFPEVVSARWIGSVHAWWNRFPRVMKPKLYLVDRAELLEALRGAMPLEVGAGAVRALRRRCSPDELLP